MDANATVPTRQRLLDAGMRLFAEQGYSATSVGQIEAAAGLQPRRGGLYKHFATKEALLQAAVQGHLDRVQASAVQIGHLATEDLESADRSVMRGVLEGMGSWMLGELDDQRELINVLEHDGDRLDVLAAVVREQLIDVGHRAAADLIEALGGPDLDAEALAVVLVGALVALRRTSWTFGDTALGVSDERVLTPGRISA